MTSRFSEQQVRMFEMMPLSPAQSNARTWKAFPVLERASPKLLAELSQRKVSQAPEWANGEDEPPDYVRRSRKLRYRSLQRQDRPRRQLTTGGRQLRSMLGKIHG